MTVMTRAVSRAVVSIHVGGAYEAPLVAEPRA